MHYGRVEKALNINGRLEPILRFKPTVVQRQIQFPKMSCKKTSDDKEKVVKLNFWLYFLSF